MERDAKGAQQPVDRGRLFLAPRYSHSIRSRRSVASLQALRLIYELLKICGFT